MWRAFAIHLGVNFMGEAKRRKQLDPNYGKNQIKPENREMLRKINYLLQEIFNKGFDGCILNFDESNQELVNSLLDLISIENKRMYEFKNITNIELAKIDAAQHGISSIELNYLGIKASVKSRSKKEVNMPLVKLQF